MKGSNKQKKRLLAVLLALCCVVLCACQAKETFPTAGEIGQVNSQTVNQTVNSMQTEETVAEAQEIFTGAVVGSIDYDDGSYDPTSEEGGSGEPVDDAAAIPTVAPTFQSEYAGATPVVIDPIDKPTPTPLPKLTFAFATYEASALHMTFEAPTGWIEDASQPDAFTLINPDQTMDYPAQLTIREVPVNRAYSESELTKEIKGALDTLKSDSFRSFSPSNTATRTFMNSKGVYANYSGRNNDGVEVAGRIIASCVDKTLYILHVSYPKGYTETYVENLFHKFVRTVKMKEE